eukprot:GILJ01001076.1.p1 GENE.GILJ01001076.1~~GILJ01001076.1.p1  ORF type:complete len:633 (-),score=70.27 GILJ01001076.1:130-2028(-)
MSFVALHQTLEALGAFNTLSHFQKARTELEKKEWIRKRLTEHSLSHVVPLYEQLIELRCLVKDDKIADVDAVFDPLNQGVTNCRFNPLLAKAFAVFHTFVDPKSNSETGQVLENSMTTVSTIIDDNRQVEFLLQMEHLDEVDRVLVPGIQAVDVASNDQESTAERELVHQYIANMRQIDEIGHIGAEVANYLEANPGNLFSPPQPFLALFPRHGIAAPSPTFASWKAALEELAQTFPIIWRAVDESANSLPQPVVMPQNMSASENISASGSVPEPEPSASSSNVSVPPNGPPASRTRLVSQLLAGSHQGFDQPTVDFIRSNHLGVLRIVRDDGVSETSEASETSETSATGFHYARGWILTNAHVLCGARQQSVDMSRVKFEIVDHQDNIVYTFQGRKRLAAITEFDLSGHDLAVIKLGKQIDASRTSREYKQWETEEQRWVDQIPELQDRSVDFQAILARDSSTTDDECIRRAIAECLGAGLFVIHFGEAMEGKQVSLPGHFRHRMGDLGFVHTSHTRNGSSGSPVFTMKHDRKALPQLLAVSAEGDPANLEDDTYNVAHFLHPVMPAVNELLAFFEGTYPLRLMEPIVRGTSVEQDIRALNDKLKREFEESQNGMNISILYPFDLELRNWN